MSNYIPIYVPETHHREMLEHLMSLLSRARDSQVLAEPSAASSAQGAQGWSEEVWQNVWPLVMEDTRELLVVLAKHPGEWVSIDVFEHHLGGDSFRAIQSALSSLTKQMKKHGQAKWPFEVKTDKETRRAKYLMTEATATSVLRLADA